MKTASEIFEERTEGMIDGPWIQQGPAAGVAVPIGDPYGDHDWELEQVLSTGTEEDAKGIVFLRNLRDALLEYIRLEPPQFREDSDLLGKIEGCIIENTGDGEFAAYVVDFLEKSRAALDALLERMTDEHIK